jgi:hypothetical protein
MWKATKGPFAKTFFFHSSDYLDFLVVWYGVQSQNVHEHKTNRDTPSPIS